MNEVLGIVASGSEGQAITFYSQNPIKTDYVKVLHDKCRTIYKITRVEIVNKRFAESDFIRYISSGDDYSKYNIYIARAVPIAHINEHGKKYIDYWYIALPGSGVEIADDEEISLAHGIYQTPRSQSIGWLRKMEKIPVWIDFNNLLTTHMAVVGRSGQGKSNFTKIVLKNLPMQFMVFTPANEYIDTGAKRVDAFNFSIPEDMDLLKKVLELNSSEATLLKKALHVLPNEEKPVETGALAERIINNYENVLEDNYRRNSVRNNNFVASLCAKLRDMDIKIGAKTAKVPKDSYVFNMQKLSQDEQELYIYLYLNQILNDRRKRYEVVAEGEEIPNRIVIFLEEAHNFIPSMKKSFCKDIINSIAREGRKLGIHLVLLSQRPRYLDPTTLSQCGSLVVFNLTNPDDIDYLMDNSNFYDNSYKMIIQGLQIGECMITSDYLEQGIDCKIKLLQN